MEPTTKRAIAILAIIFFILLLLGLYFSKYSKEQKGDSAIPSEDSSQQNYEQIKKDIATGKLNEAPAGVNKTKELIILEYIYDCYHTDDTKAKIDCYEQHYLSKEESLRKEKNACQQLNDESKQDCLSNFYYDLAAQVGSIFCDAITNQDLKDKCKATVE